MMTLEEAKAAVSEAQAALSAYEGETGKQVQAVRASREASKEPLVVALRNAKQVLIKAEESIEAHPWTGKRVVRKVSIYNKGWRPTSFRDEVGVVEKCIIGTELPANRSSYSLPKVGQSFVRAIKKDGTVGKAILSERVGNEWKLADGEAA